MSGSTRLVAMLTLLPVSVLAPVFASQDPPQKVFSSRSELVVVHVAVMDGKSRLIPGLPREAFTVYEDGRPETVSFFHNEDNPVTVGLVLDCSGSMQRKREAVITAGLAFAKSSHPSDEMFTVNFNEQVWSGLPPSKPFTTDIEELRTALERSTARGKTALFDGLRTALAHLANGHQPKKALIVVSDGGDNASVTTFEQVLNQALRMDAVIYTISMRDQYDQDAKPDVLRKLSRSTGGEAFFPRKLEDVTGVLEEIARDIRSGYTLGYVPPAGADGFRSIRVEARAPNGHKLSVRARSGYLSGAAVARHDRN
jgi:Ca-activated chloride channel homolog